MRLKRGSKPKVVVPSEIVSLVFPALVYPNGFVLDAEHVESFDISKRRQRNAWLRRKQEHAEIYHEWSELLKCWDGDGAGQAGSLTAAVRQDA